MVGVSVAPMADQKAGWTGATKADSWVEQTGCRKAAEMVDSKVALKDDLMVVE